MATPLQADAKTARDVMGEIARSVDGKQPRLGDLPGLGRFLRGAGDLLDVSIRSAEVRRGVLFATISIHGKDSELIAWPKNYREVVSERKAPVFYTLILAKGDLAADALLKPRVLGAEALKDLAFADPLIGIWKGKTETFKVDDAPEEVQKRLERLSYKPTRTEGKKEKAGDELIFREGVNLYAKFKIGRHSTANTVLSAIAVDRKDRHIYAWIDLKGVARFVRRDKPADENIAFRFVSDVGTFNPRLGSWFKPRRSELIIQSEGGTKPVTAGVYGKVDYAFAGKDGDVLTADSEISRDFREKTTYLRTNFNKTGGEKGLLEETIGLKGKDVGLELAIRKGEKNVATIHATVELLGQEYPLRVSFRSGGFVNLRELKFEMPIGDLEPRKAFDLLKALSKNIHIPKSYRDLAVSMLKSSAKKAGKAVLTKAALAIIGDQKQFEAQAGPVGFSVIARGRREGVETFVFLDIDAAFRLDGMIPNGTPGRNLVAGVEFSPPLIALAGTAGTFDVGDDEFPEALKKKIEKMADVVNGKTRPIEKLYIGPGVNLFGAAPLSRLPGVADINRHITLEMPDRGFVRGSIGTGFARLLVGDAGGTDSGFSFSVPVRKFDPTPRALTSGRTFYSLSNPRLEFALAIPRGAGIRNAHVDFGVVGDTVVDIGGSNKAKTEFKFKAKLGAKGAGVEVASITDNKGADGKVRPIRHAFGLKWFDLENFTVKGEINAEGFDFAFRGAGRVKYKTIEGHNRQKSYDLTVSSSALGVIKAMRFEANSWRETDLLTIAQLIVLNGKGVVDLDKVPQFSILPIRNPSDRLKAQPGFKKGKVLLSYVAPGAGNEDLGLEEGVRISGRLNLYGLDVGDVYGAADDNGFFIESKTPKAEFGPMTFRQNKVFVDVPFQLGTIPKIRIAGHTPEILGTAANMEMVFAYEDKEKGIVARAGTDVGVLGNQFKAAVDVSSLLAQRLSRSTFGFEAVMEQKYLDTIRDATKKEIDKGFGALDSDYAKAESDLQKANDHLEDELQALSSIKKKVRDEIARARRPIESARRKVGHLKGKERGLKKDIRHYENKAKKKAERLDFIGAAKALERAASKGIELAGVEVARRSAEAVLSALIKSFDFIPVESHPLVLAKLTEVKVAQVGVKAAEAVVGATRAVNEAMRQALNGIVNAAGDVYNVRRAIVTGDLKNALTGNDALKLGIDATVLGGDMSLRVGFKPQDPEYTATQVAKAARQFAEAILYQKKRKHRVDHKKFAAEIAEAKLGFVPRMRRAGFSYLPGEATANAYDRRRSHGSVFMFVDDEYIDYDFSGSRIRPGYPKKIDKDWLGIGIAAFLEKSGVKLADLKQAGIKDPSRLGVLADAVVRVRENRVYFFKGPGYARFERQRNGRWTLVKSGSIRKDWPGLAGAIDKIIRAQREKETGAQSNTPATANAQPQRGPRNYQAEIARLQREITSAYASRATPGFRGSEREIARKLHRLRQLQMEASLHRADRQAEAELQKLIRLGFVSAGDVNDIRARIGQVARTIARAEARLLSAQSRLRRAVPEDREAMEREVAAARGDLTEANGVKSSVMEMMMSRALDFKIDAAFYTGALRERDGIAGDNYQQPRTPFGNTQWNQLIQEQQIQGQSHVYFFVRDHVISYDIATRRVKGTTPIKGHWPGLYTNYIDAAVRHPNDPGTVYFFSGDQYVSYQMSRGLPYRAKSGSIKIRRNWTMSPEFSGAGGSEPTAGKPDPHSMDAAVRTGRNLFLLKGNQVVAFEKTDLGGWNRSVEGIRMTIGYPKLIRDVWPGIWQNGIDAAVRSFATDRHVIFFRGGEYRAFDLGTRKVTAQGEIAKRWPALWQAIKEAGGIRIDAAHREPGKESSGNVLFYVGDKYFAFDGKRATKPAAIKDTSRYAGVWQRGIGAAASWDARHTWFTRGKESGIHDWTDRRMVRGYPKDSADVWRGIPRYFIENEAATLEKIKPDPLVNLLSRATNPKVRIRQSSNYRGTYPVNQAVDGDLKTFNHTNNGANEAVMIDLGAVYKIDEVVIYNRIGNAKLLARMNGAEVMVSDWPLDRETWHPRPSDGVSRYSIERAKAVNSMSVRKTGRYVVVRQTRNDYLHMAEIQVLGKPAVVRPQSTRSLNLALRKPVRQSSLYGNHQATAAVDANPATYNHTSNGPNEWLEVDLGAVHRIDSIVLKTRPGAKLLSRLNGALVYVSDWPLTDLPFASRNDASVHVFNKVGRAKQRTVLRVRQTGRYVRVQLPASNYLHLTELAVYGSGKTVRPGTEKPTPADLSVRRSMLRPGAVRILSASSDRCLDATGKGGNGVRIETWDCGVNAKNQAFRVEYRKPDYFLLRHPRDNRCVDASKNRSGAPVHSWKCHGKPNQLWRKRAVRDGWFEIESGIETGKDSAYCLTAEGGGFVKGTPYVIRHCDAPKTTFDQAYAVWNNGPKAKPVDWPATSRRLPGLALDITVDRNDRAYVVGTNGILYSWNPEKETWIKTNRAAARIASARGELWTLEKNGGVHVLANGRWRRISPVPVTKRLERPLGGIGQQKPVPLSDIGVGPTGAVFAVDSEGTIHELNGKRDRWRKIRGGLIRIAVDSHGLLWGVNKANEIWRQVLLTKPDTRPRAGTVNKVPTRATGRWQWQRMSGKAKDIAINDRDEVIIIGTNSAPYRLHQGKWERLPGGAGASAAVDSRGRPWYARTDKKITGWWQKGGNRLR